MACKNLVSLLISVKVTLQTGLHDFILKNNQCYGQLAQFELQYSPQNQLELMDRILLTSGVRAGRSLSSGRFP